MANLADAFQHEEDMLEAQLNNEMLSPEKSDMLSAIDQEVNILGNELEEDIDDDVSNLNTNKHFEIQVLLRSADGQSDNAICAQIERALKLGKDVFDNDAAEVIKRKSNLLSLSQVKAISSPLKESLSGMNSPKEDPNYHADWVDTSGIHWIQFKPVNREIDVFVSGEELSKVLKYKVTQHEELLPPTWVKGSLRADFFRCIFEPVLPAHFFPSHTRDMIHYLEKTSTCRKAKEGVAKELIRSWYTAATNTELTLTVAVRNMILESERKICLTLHKV